MNLNMTTLNSGYHENIIYLKDPIAKKQRTRKRRVIWFNPPFSINVKTDIGRKFFNILEKKNFPKDHSFHKIVNKNTVKLSYSCMPNMGRILKNHNKSIIGDTDNHDEVHQPGQICLSFTGKLSCQV